jgi:hypothetical protein
MLVYKDAVFDSVVGQEVSFAKNHSLVCFISDDPIDATKAQETFEALRIKKHYVHRHCMEGQQAANKNLESRVMIACA